MNLTVLLSIIVPIAMVCTIIIAIRSYRLVKVRESRNLDGRGVSQEKKFFVPYVPESKR